MIVLSIFVAQFPYSVVLMNYTLNISQLNRIYMLTGKSD
jgi:hypothetical protein